MTSRYGETAGDTKKNYDIPQHFKLSEIAARQKAEALALMRQQANPMQQSVQLDAAQQRCLKPQTVSIYQLPQNP